MLTVFVQSFTKNVPKDINLQEAHLSFQLRRAEKNIHFFFLSD